MAIAPSLFDAPVNAPLVAASDWITGTLLGGLAAILCVIAVAFVGLLMMSGRLAIRDAVRVVLGCFVLLGAPMIAAGLRGVADETAINAPPRVVNVTSTPEPAALPPSNYDPYAGASLRSD